MRSTLLAVVLAAAVVVADDDTEQPNAPNCGRVALGTPACKLAIDPVVGCETQERAKDLNDMLAAGDREAWRKAATAGVLEGTCDVFSKGDEVWVLDQKLSGFVRIRKQGEPKAFWTARWALWPAP